MLFEPLYQESRINILEGEIELLEAKLLKNDDKIMNGNSMEDVVKNENDENLENELTEKVCFLTKENKNYIFL